MVCQRESVGQFATFFLLRWDQQTHQIRYTNAGHNFPILLRADGSHELLEAGGLVVGMLEGMPYAEGTCSLGPGDRLLLYTDGVTEGESPSGEMYGEDRLLADFQALPSGLTAPAMVDALLAAHERFLAGREPGDDVTVMVVVRNPSSDAANRPTGGE
jgi:sigma-B regulation protein RsbU (phosphoserine phosphatase)